MVDFADWLHADSPADESLYAARAWNLILRNPVELVFKRGNTMLETQTVRVEYDNEESPIQGSSGAQGSRRDVIVYGVKNHPNEDVLDTDIKRGDQFSYLGRHFKVTDVIVNLGSVQAMTEAVS